MTQPSPEQSRARRGAPSAESATDVRHEPDAGRFVVPLGDDEAVAEYSREGDTIAFTHTVVPSAHEGQGVGSRLASAALVHARAEGLRVIPQCHFIAGWVADHPEYHELVHPDWRSRLPAD